MTEDSNQQNSSDQSSSEALSERSKMTHVRNAIIKNSTKAVPDQYHHLFMDIDEEEQKKSFKPKAAAPMKRIKTITTTSLKRNSTLSRMGTLKETDRENDGETIKSSMDSKVSSHLSR